MAELKEFKLPDVGEGLTEADIVAWHVKPGDQVEDGQIIVEIETAKAVVELPSPWDGTVARLLAEEGQTVEVGVPIIAVEVAGQGTPIAPNEPRFPPPRPPRARAADEHCGSRCPQAEEPERHAVLVGYGVKTSSTTRRARKTPRPSRRRPDARKRPRFPPHPRYQSSRRRWPPSPPPGPSRANTGQAAGAQAGQGPRHQPGRAGGQRPGRLDHPGRRAAGGGRGYPGPFGRFRERIPDGHRCHAPSPAARSASRSAACASTWPRPWCRARSPRRTSPSSCRST